MSDNVKNIFKQFTFKRCAKDFTGQTKGIYLTLKLNLIS